MALVPTAFLLVCAIGSLDAARISTESLVSEIDNVNAETHTDSASEGESADPADFENAGEGEWRPEFPRYLSAQDVNWDPPYSHLNASSLLESNATKKPYEGAKCCWRHNNKGIELARWFYWRTQDRKYESVWTCPDNWAGAWFDSTCEEARARAVNKRTYREDSDIVICYKKGKKSKKYKYYTWGGAFRSCQGIMADKFKRLCRNNYGKSYKCYEKDSMQSCKDYQTIEHIDVEADSTNCGKGYSKAVNPGSRFCPIPNHSDKAQNMYDYMSWSACAGFPKNCQTLYCHRHSDEDRGNSANGGCWRNCPSAGGA